MYLTTCLGPAGLEPREKQKLKRGFKHRTNTAIVCTSLHKCYLATCELNIDPNVLTLARTDCIKPTYRQKQVEQI